MTTRSTATKPVETPKSSPTPLNGVDVPTLFATIDAVGAQPELAKFQFRATNRWISGTHSQTRIQSFSGAGGEHEHKSSFVYDADHHPVLCGEGHGPTPVEFVLHALVSCLMSGIGNIAAARKVRLHEVTAHVEGNIDLLGLLGLSDQVRNGYQGIDVRFEIKGDASPEKLQQIVEQSRARSAVYDVVTRGVPVNLRVNTN